MNKRSLLCTIDGCERPARSKSYCHKHYERWRVHGDPLFLSKPRQHYVWPTCSVSDCDRPKDARGLCVLHYRRWRKYGTTDLPAPVEPHAAFMANVTITDGCWPWTGFVRDDGYGQAPNETGERAPHRISYEMHVGPIPAGLQLDHLCHTMSSDCPGGASCPHRRCVNPAHLEPVPLAENVRRGNRRRGHTLHAGLPRAS